MAAYKQGVYVEEEPTALKTPINGNSALQVIFGTAPVNMTKEPSKTVNVPILCNSFSECVENLGYSGDYDSYTLCQSMDANFRQFAVAPVVFVNVLDPEKHKKTNDETQCTVVNKKAKLAITGVLATTLVIKDLEGNTLEASDYTTSFDDDGTLDIVILKEGVETIKVTCDSIDPSLVTEDDIIGGYDAETGKDKGLEVIRQVYPKLRMTAGLILAPGWSHKQTVAAVMEAKCKKINGVFGAECIIDLDTTTVKKYTDCQEAKELVQDISAIVCWPMVMMGGKKTYMSAVKGAEFAYYDALNDDVPCMPSNHDIPITSTVLSDGTEVVLDTTQANVVNGTGVVTALNNDGWKSSGNEMSIYPSNTDPKDHWINARRFFTWWGNSFICTYKKKVGSQADKRLIESICNSENIRGNAYVAQGKCAAAHIEYREEDNTADKVLAGEVTFRTHLAPYTPAKVIKNILSFDPDALLASLN